MSKKEKTTIRIKKWANKSPIIFLISVVSISFTFFLTMGQGINVIKATYNNTIGKKQIYEEKIHKLSTEVQINIFSEILGEYIIKNTHDIYREYIYNNDFFYTQVTTDLTDKVLAYVVTTKVQDFNPIFTIHEPYTLVLGKTKFSETVNLFGDPVKITHFLGARRFNYTEVHYLGNPGKYLSYIVGINDAGTPIDVDMEAYHLLEDELKDEPIESSDYKKFRTNSVINSFGEISPLFSFSDEQNFIPIGIDLDQVRILK